MNIISFDTEAFRAEIESHFRKFDLPGLSVAVVHDGEIVYRQNEGFSNLQSKTPIQDDDIFPIASVTKTMTAVMMMKYQEQGLISVDDYLLDYPFNRIGWTLSNFRPEVRLKHFLSHTSEGIPGTDYIYNGGRYNCVYGVFEALSGQLTLPEAYRQEMNKNFIEVLGLESTIAGFPADKSHPLYPRIVMPYIYRDGQFVPDEGAYNDHDVYPSTGMLTSVDDLATYAIALDRNSFISSESYRHMTTPFLTGDGRELPCGLGWFSEKYGEYSLHWAYGYGNSYASLLLRVPEEKLTFIMLSNSCLPSEALRLGYGYVLQSPFAVSFMKYFVLNGELPRYNINYTAALPSLRNAVSEASPEKFYFNEILAQALIQRNAETKFGAPTHRSSELLQLLNEKYPQEFNRFNPPLIFLVSDIHDPAMEPLMDNLLYACQQSGNFNVDIISEFINYYEKIGRTDKSLPFYHELADSKGYEGRGNVISACSFLGGYYMERGDFDQGRKYLWNAVLYARSAGYDNEYIDTHIEKMRVKQPEPEAAR